MPAKRRSGHSPDGPEERSPVRGLLSPVKTEPVSETPPHLYRVSPSPAPPSSIRFHSTFQTSSSNPPFENGRQQPYTNGSVPYHTPSSSPSIPFTNGPNPGSVPSSYSDSYSDGGNYPLSGSEDGRAYSDPYSSQSSSQHFCQCRTSPGPSVAYVTLAQQLQTSLNTLRQYTHHPQNTSCVLYRRIVELNDTMQYVFVGHSPGIDRDSRHLNGIELPDSIRPSPYDHTPDRESPTVSTSSGQTYHSSSGGVSPHEWNTLTTGGYNPYFPPQNDHHGLYNHVIS